MIEIKKKRDFPPPIEFNTFRISFKNYLNPIDFFIQLIQKEIAKAFLPSTIFKVLVM